MGNRAVITTEDRDIGIYLHWNGGRDNVNGFLAYCKMKGYRSPETDDYGWASLCMVLSNFNGGELSVGIGKYVSQDRDNYDNGVYIIKNWNVIGRIYCNPDYEQDTYKLDEFMKAINERMPEDLQESEDKIDMWVAEHGEEYTFDVNLVEKDEDLKAVRLEEIVLDQDGEYFPWYVGTLKGVCGVMYSQKKNLDKYSYRVHVRAKDGTPEYVMIDAIKKAVEKEVHL